MQVYNYLFLAVIAAAIITYVFAFENGRPTCDKYILNTYLYLLTFVLFFNAMLSLLLAKGVAGDLSLGMFIAFVLVYIGVFLGAVKLPMKYNIIKHLLAFVFVTMSSYLFAFIYYEFGLKAVVEVAVLVGVLFIVLTILAFKFQSMISTRLSWTFFIVFLVLVIAEALMTAYYPGSIWTKMIILAVVLILAYLLLVKTKKMIVASQACVEPDYVAESLGFFITIKNMLVNLLMLRKGRR